MFKLYAEMKTGGAVAAYSSFENDCYNFDFKEENGKIKGVLRAKKDIKMLNFTLSCEKNFESDDLFYANGYQAWTTSREFSRSDCLNGIMKISNISKFTKDLTGISGDYSFAEYGKTGVLSNV